MAILQLFKLHLALKKKKSIKKIFQELPFPFTLVCHIVTCRPVLEAEEFQCLCRVIFMDFWRKMSINKNYFCSFSKYPNLQPKKVILFSPTYVHGKFSFTSKLRWLPCWRQHHCTHWCFIDVEKIDNSLLLCVKWLLYI